MRGLLPENSPLTAISGQIILILMLDQFSLKQDQLQILQTVHLKTAVTLKEKFVKLSFAVY